MAILAGFAYGFVLQSLIVPGNSTLTTNNIKSSMTLFRFGIVSFLLIVICDILAAWGIHVFFKQINEHLSLLAAWFRLVYSAILAVALLNFIFVTLLCNDEIDFSMFEKNQLDTLVVFFLKGFEMIWSIGLVIFGCHLFVLGYLVYKTDFISNIFSILLIIASLCYMSNHLANLLVSNYEKYKTNVELFMSLPMIIGELGFGLWLLFKGGDSNSNKKRE